MGGPGSSRWGSYEKKEIIENCLNISVVELNHLGFLRANIRATGELLWQDDITGLFFGSAGLVLDTIADRPYLRVSYDVAIWDRNLGSIDFIVKLEPTACYFGGKRFWMRCPFIKDGKACDRRVAKLYLPPGENYFGCRECHSLSYESRQVKDHPYERPQFDMQLSGNGTRMI